MAGQVQPPAKHEINKKHVPRTYVCTKQKSSEPVHENSSEFCHPSEHVRLQQQLQLGKTCNEQHQYDTKGTKQHIQYKNI